MSKITIPWNEEASHLLQRVSETMDEIIEMIENPLLKRKNLSVDGEVFFHVFLALKAMGKLSKKKLDELQHGRRVPS